MDKHEIRAAIQAKLLVTPMPESKSAPVDESTKSKVLDSFLNPKVTEFMPVKEQTIEEDDVYRYRNNLQMVHAFEKIG